MKKFVRLTAAVLVLMMAVCSAAFAEKKDAAVKANEKAAKKIVQQANKEIKDLVKNARKSAEDDVAEMAAATEAVAAGAIAACAELGIEVECSFSYYWVDGQRVAVDPLKVINKN